MSTSDERWEWEEALEDYRYAGWTISEKLQENTGIEKPKKETDGGEKVELCSMMGDKRLLKKIISQKKDV